MKKILLTVCWIMCSLCAAAQQTNQSILGDQHGTLRGTGAPSNLLCPAGQPLAPPSTLGQLYVENVTGVTYTCSVSGWVPAPTGGTGTADTIFTITPSSAPALLATNKIQTITLNTATVPTISGIVSASRVEIEICQPSSGGPYTWTWPAAFVNGMTVTQTPGSCSVQSFRSFNGTTLVAENIGSTNSTP